MASVSLPQPLVIFVYLLCLDLINFKMSSALLALSVFGCTGAGLTSASAGLLAVSTGFVSVDAGALACGVVDFGRETPAGLKYCPYFSKSYASPSTDFSNNSLIILISASVGSFGLKSDKLCKPNLSIADHSASSSGLSLLDHFEVE